MPSTKQAIEISLPSADDLAQGANKFVALARSFKVESAEDSAAAQVARSAINLEFKRLTEERLSITRPLDESKARVMNLYRTPLDALNDAMETYGKKILAFNREQERIRAELQRKLDAQAELERQRLVEIARKAAEKGQENKAQAFEERATMVVAPIIRTEAPKVAGTQFRKVWKFRIRDKSKINRPFLIPDEPKIGSVVRSMKKDAEGLVGEGLEVYSEDIIASGSAR